MAKQKDRAMHTGRRGMRWGQMQAPANSATNYKLPHFIQQLGAGEDERSVLVVDSRDRGIRSPFQGWLVDEILLNAQNEVNILSDRQLVRQHQTGFHMNLFYVRIIDGVKLILVGSLTSYGNVPCAAWDSETSDVIAHKAFQPFRWPSMTEESSTWVDFKMKIEGHLLLRLELRGYRSDSDMSVQSNYVNDAVFALLKDTLYVPSCVITVFQGWRVIAVSFEVGGRLYVCSNGGVVIAMDYPLCPFEMRLTTMSSPDSIGMDADRLEFRFRSSGDAVEVACSQVAAPSTWMLVSRVTGPTLVKNSSWCRGRNARVEGPDHKMQLFQLAGIHAHWTAACEATSIEETGPRVGAVQVDSHPSNLHLTCESPLFKCGKVIAPKASLALQAHDENAEQQLAILPPVTGGPSVVPMASVSSKPWPRRLVRLDPWPPMWKPLCQ